LGRRHLHEATDTDTRVLNDVLLEAAHAEQDAKAASTGGVTHLHSLDLGVSWGPWRGLEGADTTLARIRLVTEPSLGLQKIGDSA
jgi:hypothetical protein